MSEVLNHYQCAKETLNQLSEDNPLRLSIQKHYDAYRLGSQGPDFFYYNVFDKNAQKAGSLLHSEKINKFFLEALDFLKRHPEFQEIGLAYLAGLITHHALDTETHPFIFYRTGRYNEALPKSHAFLHKYYEILLDTALMQYEYETQAVFSKPQKVFTVSDETKAFLQTFYPEILSKLYDLKINPNALTTGIEICKQFFTATTDPFGRKKKLLKPLEKLSGNQFLLSKYLYPMYTNEFEVLNIARESWRNPLTGEIRTESYPDLYHTAIRKSVVNIERFTELLQTENPSIEEIDQIFGDRSYLSGEDSALGNDFSYIDHEFRQRLLEEKI